jgi:hypothetical protein
MFRGFVVGAAALAAALTSMSAQAGPPFGRLYTAGFEAKGEIEFEQWLYLDWQKPHEDYVRFRGRSEIEYGAAEGLLTALYLNYSSLHVDPRFGAPDDAADHTQFDGVSGEVIYQVLHPVRDPLGLALYFEATAGDHEYELEGKILLQKNLMDNDLVLVANLNVEFEWEGEHGEWERESAFEVYLGASYRIGPRWRAGIELLNENGYEHHLIFDTSEWEGTAFYAGPVIHYAGEGWWATLEYLRQLPWGSAHEPNEVNDGLLFGAERNRLLLRAGVHL